MHGREADAVDYYKKSLKSGGEQSLDWVRKAALQNLQRIANLKNNNLIKVQLGKHVVNRRSIVFLVDTSFEGGDLYMKAANKFMH